MPTVLTQRVHTSVHAKAGSKVTEIIAQILMSAHLAIISVTLMLIVTTHLVHTTVLAKPGFKATDQFAKT